MRAETAGLSASGYRLEDRYVQASGRVFLTGTQALVRALLDQARRDRAAGLNTAGFVSGYRGSPLGGVDLELWRAAGLLAQNRIEFLPAVNEDLAATAVLGTQQVETDPARKVEGVFSLWYGKGPGVDRAGDALKHGNAYGSSPHGGVLVVAGDDHGCVSSSMPHQSDVAFMAWFMPTLNPASVAEYLSFAEYGFALSRFSGMWVGFKAISETVESGASIDIQPPRAFRVPDFAAPPGGLHYRWPDLPGPQIEERMEAKKHAAYAFARANPIDRRIYGIADAAYGIVTTGKGHLDLMEALRLLGLDEAACRRLGIDIYKVGMVWPLALHDALEFVRGKREVLVVEEKRGIIESQFKEYFYDYPGAKPQRMVGKHDEDGNRLLPWTGELSPRMLAPVVAERLDAIFPGLGLVPAIADPCCAGASDGGYKPIESVPLSRLVSRGARLTNSRKSVLAVRAAALAADPGRIIQIPGASRTPYFCSGCPHNTSTKVPEGSKALAGIGCHFMASWMDRETSSLIQMGGEGVNWAASSKFTGNGHIFQNLGEGTYYHSGSMAIRQAIAANANITYKILYNDAVAMTGGQPVDGPLSVHAIAHGVRAEGVRRIALVSDQPAKFRAADFPPGVTIHHRRDLDSVQRDLRQVPGVSVLIYEQACATEKRRRRKRGAIDDPKRYPFINEAVCEGCGDCSLESNCLSVEPTDTPFGRKRQINLSSCNKDFSCLNGFCPSFVTVEGARRRLPATPPDLAGEAARLPRPALPALAEVYDLLVAGVGGTGVITIGALISMAAHLDGKGVSVLDFTGFAQKFGPVLGYVRIGAHPDVINQARIDWGAADALIGCDVVVASSPKASTTYRRGTRAVVNTAEMPTGDVVRFRDADLAVGARLAAIGRVVGDANIATLDANGLAENLFGDAVFANMIMLGFAWQAGLVPVSLAALTRAVELNGVEVDRNHAAFAAGRLVSAIAGPCDAGTSDGGYKPIESVPLSRLVSRAPRLTNSRKSVLVHARPQPANPRSDRPRDGEPVDALIGRHAGFLTEYQDAAWAARYCATVERVRQAEKAHGSEVLTEAVARGLFKLMSYKDEYEVARLYTAPDFQDELRRRFEGEFKVRYHLAPPLLAFGRDARGRPRKREFGPWMRFPFRLLACLKRLRGTAFDVFGYTDERRMERSLIGWYENLIGTIVARLQAEPPQALLALARAPLDIRGYGPVKASAAKRALADVAAVLAAGSGDGAPVRSGKDDAPAT